MKGFIERVRDTVRLHNRWKFSWKQAWRMTSPSFVVRLNGMKGQ
jgi:hypothetical protein